MTVQLNRIFQSGIGILLSAIFGIALSKLISVTSGPEKLGEFGIYRQFIQVALVFLSFGNGFSLIEGLAKSKHKNDFANNALTYYLSSIILVSLLVLIFQEPISDALFQNQEKSQFVLIAPFIFIFAGLYLFLRYSLSGLGEVLRSSVSQALPFLFLFAFYFFETRFHILYLEAYFAALIFTYLISIKKIRIIPSKILAIKRNGLFERTSISTMATGVTGFLTILIIKILVTKFKGIEGTGMVEASLNLALYSTLILLNSFSIYYLPTLSSGPENFKFMRQYLKIIILLAAVLTLIISLGREIIIPLFYSDKFTESVAILKWFALGEFIKCINWFYIFSFIALSHKRLYIIIDISCNIAFILITYYFLSNGYELESVGISYVLFQALYLVIASCMFPYKKKLGYHYIIIPILCSTIFYFLTRYVI